MPSVYALCKRLIDLGRMDGLQDKMDVYLANDRLTVEEYNALTEVATLKKGKEVKP